MRTSLPDEAGWYWVKMIPGDASPFWCMIHLDMDEEVAVIWDGEHPAKFRSMVLDLCEFLAQLKELVGCEWYGPFNCPGGPFGSNTIVMNEETHQQAAAEQKAICVTYVDYQHCVDEQHHCSITSRTLRSRQEADKLCHRDATECDLYVGDHSSAKTETLPPT